MDAAEWDVLRTALGHPTMWAFAILAGEVGLDAAADCCRSRSVPDGARAKLAAGHYTVDHLPGADLVARVRLGARLESERRRRARRGRPRRAVDVARAVGVGADQAAAAYRALRALGWARWRRQEVTRADGR